MAVNINWGLAAPNTNLAQNALQGYQQGRQVAQQRASQNALAGYDSTNPDSGAQTQTALIKAGDLSGAASVGAINQQQSVLAATKLKTQQRQAVSDLLQKKDLAGAYAAAAASGDKELMDGVKGIADHAKETAGVMAAVGNSVASLPYEQRKPAIAQQRDVLLSRGLDPTQIDNFDPTDQNIKTMVGSSLELKDQIDNQFKTKTLAQGDEKIAEDKRSNLEKEKTGRISASASMIQAHTAQTKAANGEWQVLNDPTNNTPYRYNTTLKQATTLNGDPYSPTGAAKLGGGGAPRSIAALAAQKFIQENPDATSTDISNFNADLKKRQSAAVAFAGGKQGQATNSINVSIAHLGTMGELASALGNGDIPAFNKLAQAVAEQTGQPAPVNFDAAKQIVSSEIVKAITAGGGALADRQEAEKAVRRANSPGQLAGVIKTQKELLAGQLNGLRLQYKNSTGLDDFETHLLPQTRTELEGLDAGHVASAGPPAAAVAHLKSNPALAAAFDQKYGSGASKQALGK